MNLRFWLKPGFAQPTLAGMRVQTDESGLRYVGLKADIQLAFVPEGLLPHVQQVTYRDTTGLRSGLPCGQYRLHDAVAHIDSQWRGRHQHDVISLTGPTLAAVRTLYAAMRAGTLRPSSQWPESLSDVDIAKALLAGKVGGEGQDRVARRVVLCRATWMQLVHLAETLREASKIEISASDIATVVLDAVVAKTLRPSTEMPATDDAIPIGGVPDEMFADANIDEAMRAAGLCPLSDVIDAIQGESDADSSQRDSVPRAPRMLGEDLRDIHDDDVHDGPVKPKFYFRTKQPDDSSSDRRRCLQDPHDEDETDHLPVAAFNDPDDGPDDGYADLVRTLPEDLDEVNGEPGEPDDLRIPDQPM